MDDIKEIPANKLSAIISSDQWTTLDVRSSMERSAGYLPGLHIPLDDLVEEFGVLPTQKKVLIYCRCGNRSAAAIQKLQLLNYSGELYQLKGGIFAVHKEEARTSPGKLIFSN